ncbi:hypothetical protein [Desulfonatronum parangueonense]
MEMIAEGAKVLTMEHPSWDEFIDNLKDVAMSNHIFDDYECSPSTTDLDITRTLLKKMEGIDVCGTLDYIREGGSYCDCELLIRQGIGRCGKFTDKVDRGKHKVADRPVEERKTGNAEITDNQGGSMEEIETQAESAECAGLEAPAKDLQSKEEPTNVEAVQANISAVEKIAHDPQLVKIRINLVNELGVEGERGNIGICAMVADSRLMKHGSAGTGPLGLILDGPSGTGKTHTKDKTLELYTKGVDYEELTSATPRSFFNLEDTLQHMVLDITEADFLKSDKKLVCVIRQFHSAGRISHQRATGSDEGLTTERPSARGSIALMTSTTEGSVEPQYDNRSIVIHTDTSRQQGRAISNRQALAVAGLANNVPEETITAWKEFHACLESFDVIIPFAPRINEFIVDQVHSTSVNRTLAQLYSAIMATTIAHQFQRFQDEQGRLIAEIADYAIVQQLLNTAFIESMAGGSAAQTDPKIQAIRAAQMIRPGDLAAELGLAKSAITKWLHTDTGKHAVEWCDEHGHRFETREALNTAKHRGTAYLRALGGFGLPSAYEVSGDPEWQVGGRLYNLYDLELNGPRS